MRKGKAERKGGKTRRRMRNFSRKNAKWRKNLGKKRGGLAESKNPRGMKVLPRLAQPDRSRSQKEYLLLNTLNKI